MCDENFIASAFSSLCSESLCWKTRDIVFFFPSFLSLLEVSGTSRHVSLWVSLEGDVALLRAELYKISAWFLVN